MHSEDSNPITTARLELRLNRPDHILALTESNEAYATISGREPVDGLREFYVSGEIAQEFIDQLHQESAPDPWQFGFEVILQETNRVIGSAGFKGPPKPDGTVEIGYGIAPGYQRQGLAAEALVSFASGHSDVRQIIAHTLPELNASTRVLEKCGFEHSAEIIDPDDGQVWVGSALRFAFTSVPPRF